MGLLLALLTLAFNLVLASRLDANANGAAQARASAALGALTVTGGHIRLPEAPDERSPEARVWVFEGTRALEQPRVPSADTLAAARLASAAPATRDVASTHTRLYALPVVQSGHDIGAVVAGVSLAPYEQSRRTALVASLVLAAAVLLAAALTARWSISRALRPVARMTRQAAEWSERDLDRRFALGPPHDELTELAATLDGLLDRLAASLRHEQRLSAELSHELRTPLASLAAEAQYALRHTDPSAEGRATLEHILQSAARMSETLDTLIAAARAQLDPNRAISDAAGCARAALAAGESPSEPTAIETSLSAPTAPVRVAVERELVERILAPLIENAVRYASATVRISIDGDRTFVSFTVHDDGPGVSSEELEAVFAPGRRGGGGAATLSPSGAGLGLALSRRLARTAGGDVHAQLGAAGGCFIVRLPSA